MKNLESIVNSGTAEETVKRLRPSALFLGIFIFGLAATIRWFFYDINGYSAMVWIWFMIATGTGVVAIWAYKVDMSAFTKSNIYKELTNKINELEESI